MKPTTLQALKQLQDALRLWPEDRKILKIYGNLPDHLDDAIIEWQTDKG